MLEETVRQVIKEVLDVTDDEIKPDEPLVSCLGVDSTEMVEITVSLKKRLNVPLKDNELTKNHSLKDIVALIESKQAQQV